MKKMESRKVATVRRCDILPASCRINIYTLGRFSLLVDGEPVKIDSPGKPLVFLKLLIALGGRDVPEPRINGLLWPDAEGDQAHSSFTTTLSRLRKLLGTDSLVLKNAQLSLNDRTCWVDNWSLERCLGELDAHLVQNHPSAGGRERSIDDLLKRVFDLYHGPFLHNEPHAGWLLPLRERLRSRFMRAIREVIGFYRHNGGNCDVVMSLYEKARELEPCSEEYCRGLMRCHAANGNRAQALTIFDNCYRMLRESFGIEPSTRTTRLYRAIKDAEQDFDCCELCAQAVE